MSHYSLTVCLPGNVKDVQAALEAVLEPYDENKEVEPYRSYEGSPSEFWWYTSLRKDAEDVANNDRSQVKPYKPNEIGWSTAYHRELTEPEQWAKIQQDADLFNSLPDPITWEALAAAYNRYFCEGLPYNDGTPLLYDPETGGAYTMTTYNPNSKWDWYSVGGRYSDKYLMQADASPLDLIKGQRSFMGPESKGPQYVDGGRKSALDLKGMRREAAYEAGVEWDGYHALVDHLPEAVSWKGFVARVEAEEIGIDEARRLYREQPRVAAVRGTDFDTFFGPDSPEYYGVPREVFASQAAERKVPGYCLLTLDSHWMAPGEMGWFGMSSDTEGEMAAFKAQANDYISNLPDDTWIITVDLHI